MAISEEQRQEAEDLYLKQGLTRQEIAERLDISLRTIQRWAKAGKWRERLGERKSPKIVSIKRKEERAIANAKAKPEPVQSAAPCSKGRQGLREIDEQEIVEGAIASLAAILASTEIDTRGIGGVANALIRCLEYRRKIDPPSVAELAEQIVEMGVSPTDLVKALKIQWEKQA